MKWKENLTEKAREDFMQRHSESKNLMRLVYGCYIQKERKTDGAEQKEEDFEDEIEGTFKLVAKKQNELQKEKDIRDKEEDCFFDENLSKYKT